MTEELLYGASGALAEISVMFAICLIVGSAVLSFLQIIAAWKINVKAGKPGWAALIPFYKNYVRCDFLFGTGLVFLFPLALGVIVRCIPSLAGVMVVLSIAYSILERWKVTKAFGKSTGFFVGLLLLPFIFYPILAFGSSVYEGVPQDFLFYDGVKFNFKAKTEQE